jgi:hypothetical protein
MEVLAQTPNVRITGSTLPCGLYRYGLSSINGAFVSMSPDTFDIFMKIVHEFPNVETIYRLVQQLGGSNITMEYSKEKLELCLTYRNLKSKIKESKISLVNADMRIIALELPAKNKTPFDKNLDEDEGFHESQSFANSLSI